MSCIYIKVMFYTVVYLFIGKINFWNNNSFFGIDLYPAVEQATDEYMSQAVIGW